ncbi:MAG: hypothetical protein BAJALOKI3v1_520020 [Promethearchaeota archaeon]|nr:MAG: hypothetical protein BAJALOKI3v1_520020 [Candidatus Lokiarchaeota archaeon]
MMSYIEKKYLKKIYDTFEDLSGIDKKLLELIEYRSFNKADEIAKSLANLNKKMNLILKQYYPEIKEIDEKLKIKSIMKFYYDLLDKLTDFIRNVETFQNIDDKYYQSLIDFIHEKEDLIDTKYKGIATRELTSFYDKKSRENLEKILESKLKLRDREFFTFGSLEEEIKKIAKLNGADSISINKPEIYASEKLKNMNTAIRFERNDRNRQKIEQIGKALNIYLQAKGYRVVLIEKNLLLTNAPLLQD